MSGPGRQDFLSRWSQRKRAAVETAPEDAPTDVVPETDDTPDERTDDEVLEALGLPDPETLGEGDDFSRFMMQEVPARLRNRALRRLWLTNPVLANLDELLDYGEDFTDAATVVENLQTAYRAGRGYLIEEPEDAADAASPETEGTPPAQAGAPDAAPSPEAENAPADDVEAPAEIAAVDDPISEAVSQDVSAPVHVVPDEPRARAPRRMKFTFDTD